MKYQCGHLGCDLCGARECDSMNYNLHLERWSNFIVCLDCVVRAIKQVHDKGITFNEIIPDRKCGYLKEPQ